MKSQKMFLRSVCVFIALMLAATCFAGCSSSASYDSYNESSSADYYGFGESFDYYNESETSYDVVEVSDVSDGNSGESGEYERKIIKNADISMKSDDAEQCYSALLAKAVELGGYESYCSISRHESGSGKSISYNITIKIAPEKLDEFVASLSDFGEVTYSQVSEDEITAQYYDAVTRLESKEKALSRYYELLDEATDVYQVIEIQQYIDELTEEIEVFKGTLRYYDSRVDESTVDIYLYQYTEGADVPDEFEWDSLTLELVGLYIKNGFLAVINFLWSLLQWIVIITIAGSPILIPLGLVIYFVVRKRKGNKAEKAAENDSHAPKYGTAMTDDKK